MTEVSIIVLALAFVILCFNHWRLVARVNELENFIYSNMENAHFPAIKNEFTEVWVAADEIREDIEDIKKDIYKGGEEDGNC